MVLAVYRVTGLFPEGEVLIGQLRRAANQVLADMVLKKEEEALLNSELLLSYIQVAKNQNWIKEINLAILEKEYQEMAKDIRLSLSKQKKRGEKKEKEGNKKKPKVLSKREKKILEIVKNYKKIKTRDLQKDMGSLNRRTIVRDLLELCHMGYLKKTGQGRGAYYKIAKK